MPTLESLLPSLGILLLAIVLIWFTVGTQVNIRRGNRVLAWLQEGLPTLGPRATLRWLGSSVAELTIVEPRPPFREAVVLVVLEPRDLGAIWLAARARGRRDVLVFRLSLRQAPRAHAELAANGAWDPTGARTDLEPPESREGWTDATGTEIQLAHDATTDAGRLRDAWDRLARTAGGAWRLSVNPLVPHLEVHLPLPVSDGVSSRQVLESVRDLATEVSDGT
jgi:hypothetical protein